MGETGVVKTHPECYESINASRRQFSRFKFLRHQVLRLRVQRVIGQLFPQLSSHPLSSAQGHLAKGMIGGMETEAQGSTKDALHWTAKHMTARA